ncbi:Bacteriophage tail sheath protein [Desulfovibrio sp. DV]|uniref:phage tail sheath subtilisin-like domain-containing protein n=1 Tax=Desulfovibrio sp. DV TaxID=1844708 RepID=UPI00094BB3F4|nr:phage tail sheath subtilisin-like domain-containing protein [Desulfovibrio sp. DV]OLN30445.1 Bacteriophage tail sheath protein [Desulfovibrio sp. DV]
MASQNISFDTLPASIRKPGKYFEFNTKLAVRTLPANVQRMLIVGQGTAEGTQPVLTPVEVFSDEEGRTLFGTGSLAHLMVRAAITANPYLRLTVITVPDDAAGIVATGKVTLTGTSAGVGVVNLTIGAQIVQVAAALGDTAQAVAEALAERVNANRTLPVAAAAVGGVLTLAARNKGAFGNGINLDCSLAVAGLAAAVTPMAGGATDPDIAPGLAAVFADGHDIITVPYIGQTQLTALRSHLDAVSHALEQRGAIGVYAHTGTLAQATTLAGLINSGRITCALVPGTTSPAWDVAAAYAAVIASEEDPARPLNTLALSPVAVPPVAKRLGRMEQESALYNGCTPLEVGPGEKVQIVRAITTYTRDPQGVEDIALLDLTTIRTLDYIRTACRERISLRFPREKLTNRTAAKVRSELIDVLYKLEELEIVEEVKANLPGLLVERDLQDPNRLDAKIPADVVNGLHVFAGRIDLLL